MIPHKKLRSITEYVQEINMQIGPTVQWPHFDFAVTEQIFVNRNTVIDVLSGKYNPKLNF